MHLYDRHLTITQPFKEPTHGDEILPIRVANVLSLILLQVLDIVLYEGKKPITYPRDERLAT
jgi:hypothetical protein